MPAITIAAATAAHGIAAFAVRPTLLGTPADAGHPGTGSSLRRSD